MEAAQMMKSFVAFLKDESASAAVEYGVFAAGLSASVLMTIKSIGPKLYNVFAAIVQYLPGAVAVGS
jgi:Flp pilus assembly pilin Flp